MSKMIEEVRRALKLTEDHGPDCLCGEPHYSHGELIDLAIALLAVLEAVVRNKGTSDAYCGICGADLYHGECVPECERATALHELGVGDE